MSLRGVIVDEGGRLELPALRLLRSEPGASAGRPLEGPQQELLGVGGVERRVEIGVDPGPVRIVGRDRLAEEPQRLRLVSFLQAELAEVHEVLGHVGVTPAETDRSIARALRKVRSARTRSCRARYASARLL